MKLGKYTVRTALRRDNPAFPQYQILRGDKLIGVQFSVPCLSDCEWHDRQRGVYATREETNTHSGHYSANRLTLKRSARLATVPDEEPAL